MAERAAQAATDRLIQEVRDNAGLLRDTREVVALRLSTLRQLQSDIPPGKSMRDLVLRFHGFWTVNLNVSTREYLSRSALADSVNPQLLQDSFGLYQINSQFDQLNGQMQDIVYSELFVSPGKAPAAFVISETIMLQQLEWVDWLLPQYEQFLARYADEKSLGEEKVTAN